MYKKVKNKAGFLLIKGQTFPYDVLVCLGTTKQEILDYTDKKFENCFTDEEKELLNIEGKKGKVLRLKNRAFILWLPTYPILSDDFGHLAHEIFHTGDLILRAAGITLSDDSDEAFAYQIGWLTEKIYNSFNLCSSKQQQRQK